MKNEKKEVFTLQIEREDENGEFEVFDAMKYAKTYYSFDDAVEAGKEAYDEYSAIEDGPIAVCIMGGEYEMPNGDIYGEPEGLEIIRAENRDKFDESTKKLNVTKERFEKSRYFTKKYGNLEYVSESGKLYKTNKGKVLMFKESQKTDKAHTCPRCGFTGCTIDDLDILKGDCKEGGTFDASFYCVQCGGTYNVTFGLSIQDIYDTSNDENLDVDLPDSELEDDNL